MTMVNELAALARQAIAEPKAASAEVLRLGVPNDVIWPALGLIIVMSVIINSIAEFLSPNPMGSVPPFTLVFFVAGVFIGFSLAIWKIGRLMGGQGTLQDAFLLTAFLQGIVLVAQIIQLLLLILMPMVAGLFSLVVTVLGVWLNVNFIGSLHGFDSLGRSFAVFFLASLAVAVLIVILASMAGITIGGAI